MKRDDVCCDTKYVPHLGANLNVEFGVVVGKTHVVRLPIDLSSLTD